MTRAYPSAWVARLLPIAAAILVFAVGETAARVAVWWRYGDPARQIQESLDYEPFLITAGQRATYAFRPKKPGIPRVLWIGSSTAEQFTSGELQTAFGRLLGGEVEVLDAAQGGYNSTQELLLLTLYGIQLQPDLIVSLDGLNDILLATKTGRPGIPYLNLTIEQAMANPTSFWVSRLFRSSQLVNSIRKLRERRSEMAAQRDPDLMEATTDLYRSNILKMAAIARGIGARHIAVLQPYLRLRAHPPAAEQGLSRNWAYRAEFMSTAMKRLDQTLGSAVFPDNAGYVNGLAAFDGSGDTVCFLDEAHLTPDGRRILLEHVLTAIDRATRGSATPRTTATPARGVPPR